MAIITFYNGIKTQAVGYWNNGIKYREEHFNELGRNGISTMWYKNGVKAYQAGHKNGKLVLPSTKWYDNGSIYSLKDSSKNENSKIYSKEWFRNGNLKEEFFFQDTSSY